MKVKALCPFCKNDVENQHIFEVEQNEEYCYCPNCGEKLKTSEASDFYQSTIRNLLRQANYEIHVAGRFEKGYRYFGTILFLQPDNQFALTGRNLSLLLMSTTRKDRFDDVLTMANLQKDQMKTEKYRITYFESLNRAEKIIQIYLVNVKNKLTVKEYFYDLDCLKLYLSHVYNAYKLQNFIFYEMKTLADDGLSNSRVAAKIEETKSHMFEMSEILKQEFTTVQGICYKASCYKNSDIKVEIVKENVQIKLVNFIQFSLDEKKKNVHLISERVFKARRMRFITCMALMIGMSFFYAVSILMLILGLVLTEYTIPFISTFIVTFLVATAGLVSRLLIKYRIKKTRLLNNIFEL